MIFKKKKFVCFPPSAEICLKIVKFAKNALFFEKIYTRVYKRVKKNFCKNWKFEKN